jgi:hypothetical protein
MHRRQFLAGLALLTVAGSAAANELPPPAPTSAKPEEVVQNLYDRYVGDAFDYMTDPKLRERYFTAATADLLAKTFAKSNKKNEPGIDYEPLIDGQDGEVKDLEIVTKASTPTKAIVQANFKSFDQKLGIGFDMVFEKNVWRIEDIRGRKGASLKKAAQQFLKS